jgi:hypothetical protein
MPAVDPVSATDAIAWLDEVALAAGPVVPLSPRPTAGPPRHLTLCVFLR